jgi:N-acetylglucosaminyldiphosphoundecaprenol N-acetyl-beta-D-mannosaminyltransferase
MTSAPPPRRASGATARHARVTIPVADVDVDPVSEAEVVELITESAGMGQGGLVVTPNVDHLRHIAHGSWLGAVYADADLVVADGAPVVWASRLLGDPLPERVAGSDLLPKLACAAASKGLPVFFLGGADGSAEEVARRFSQRWPDLEVAGVSCPPKGFERRPGGVEDLCEEVAAAKPAIVFVGLGAPKQEYLSLRLREALPGAWMLGVGAALDMEAGRVARAPMWARRLGAEWLYRLIQEPRRLGGRYLVRDLPFTVRLLLTSWRAGQRAR